MKYYNYRFNYDNGGASEILKSDTRIPLDEGAKWIHVNFLGKNQSLHINLEKVTNVEEWATETEE